MIAALTLIYFIQIWWLPAGYFLPFSAQDYYRVTIQEITILNARFLILVAEGSHRNCQEYRCHKN